MALDHALAVSARERGEGVLRLYRWSRPTVSFGRNESAVGLYSVRGAHERGVGFVRRPTGGRAVMHADELTYAVAAPARSVGGARRMYERINRGLARALRSLGADVELSTVSGVAPLDAGPCFQSPVRGEVVAGGRKLVGSAQARIDGALLQHGSILISGSQTVLDALRGRTVAEEDTAVLGDLVHGVGVRELEDAVVASLSEGLGGAWTEDLPTASELAVARQLEETKYGIDSWTWRR